MLDADGKPVPGARLYSLRHKPGTLYYLSDVNVEVVKRESTGPDGELILHMPGDRFQGRAWPVMAIADGYGLGWTKPVKPGDDLTIRLVKDEPIAGRVIDTNGKPVANAHMRIRDLFTGRDDRLDAFIDGWKKTGTAPGGTSTSELFRQATRLW